MGSRPPATFSSLLRRHRKATIDLLVEALSLTEPERVEFVAAARLRGQADQAMPGEDSGTMTLASASTGEDGDAPEDRRVPSPPSPPSSLSLLGHILSSSQARLAVLHGRRGVSRRQARTVISVLGVLLLGSVLVLRGTVGAGTLPERSSLLCGGHLALATNFPT